jgi:hypothetical protein
MQFVMGKSPETQHATRPGARAKRREVAVGRPGFEPGRTRAWLRLRPPQGQRHVSTGTLRHSDKVPQYLNYIPRNKCALTM